MGLGSGIRRPGMGFFRDPGSGKNSFRFRIQGSKRHRIPDPQHCYSPPPLSLYGLPVRCQDSEPTFELHCFEVVGLIFFYIMSWKSEGSVSGRNSFLHYVMEKWRIRVGKKQFFFTLCHREVNDPGREETVFLHHVDGKVKDPGREET